MENNDQLSVETKISYVIAEELDSDPEELSPTVDEVINVEALEELFGQEAEESHDLGLVSFKYRDIYVNIDNQGYITIDGSTRGLAQSHRVRRYKLESK